MFGTKTTEPEDTKPDETKTTEPEPAPPRVLNAKDLELAAEVVHEALMGYGRACGHNNTAAWDDSPDWQKDQVREAVSQAVAGASGMGLALLVARAVVDFLDGRV